MKIILDLDHRFRSSDIPPVQWSKTIYAILKEGIMGNVHVKNMKLGPVVKEETTFK